MPQTPCPIPLLTFTFQRLTELMAGAVDVRLHSSQWQVQGRRDLLVRTALDMPEHDARAILRTKRGDRTFDRTPELARLHFFQGRLLLRADVERSRLDLGSAGGVRRPIDADRGDLPLPQVIDGDVVRDLEQPAREPELGAVPVDVIQDLDEGVLREVF